MIPIKIRDAVMDKYEIIKDENYIFVLNVQTFNFLFHVSILNTFYMLHITTIGIGPNDK